MAAMRQAHELGLRVYGMLCPLLPGVAAGAEEIEELVAFVKDCGAEEIFAEAVNSRCPGLKDTADSLREAGFAEAAQAVHRIRKRTEWSAYVAELLRNLQSSPRRNRVLEKLRYLLYPSRLRPADEQAIRRDDRIKWLRNTFSETCLMCSFVGLVLDMFSIAKRQGS